jgi:small subunit ribosomal protein S16
MAVKIRLARHGSKGNPFYRIVVADARSPRDGRFIDRIGTYNPRTEPSEIKVDAEKAREWLGKGAQPTDQVRNLFKVSGVL